VDVIVVSSITLMPLLLARLQPFANPSADHTEPFWGFLTSGQLAFYSIGSLAVMLMAVFRQSLPKSLGLAVGFGSVIALLFLAWLIGLDPKLTNASLTFVGITTLYLYMIVQVTRILVEAVKRIGPGDALRAGERANRGVRAGLAERKGVSDD
jgi:hypothetical protein